MSASCACFPGGHLRVVPWQASLPSPLANKLERVSRVYGFDFDEFKTGIRIMRYQVHGSALAAALLIGSIGTAYAQATIGAPGGTSGGGAAVGVGTAPVTDGTTPGLAPQAPSGVPGANLSFFTDPLSVGPSQMPPTGPIGSDPLRVGPVRLPSGGGSSGATGSSTSSEACVLPDCLPGEN
jgi:hypothetical protein